MRPFLIGLVSVSALLAFAAPAFAASKAGPVDPPTAGPLDAAAFYQGMWYEQARTPTSLTRGCEYATTEHGRDAKGRITVRDACRKDGPAGKETAIAGLGTLKDPGQNAALEVKYRFGPLRPVRTYRIIAAGPAAEWHISAEPGFDKVYIFTRAVAPPLAEVEALVARVRAIGYAGQIETLKTPGRD
jgi:apolipoprotein D and lipocalin family protein